MADWGKAAILALAAALAAPAGAQGVDSAAGPYLAAREAMRDNNFTAAAGYLMSAIVADPDNPWLIESAIAAHVGTGAVLQATPLAERMRAGNWQSQLAHMVLTAAAVEADDWAAVLAELDAGRGVSPLTDALTRAWALAGAGDMGAALDAFDGIIATPGMRSFGLYHKALALAFAGDFEGADAILSLPASEGMQRTRRAVMAHAQVLSQLGRGDEGLALIDTTFPNTTEPGLAQLRASLAAGEAVPWSLVRSPRMGLAETYYSVAGAIVDETDDASVLFHLRTALALDPDHVDATLLAAQILERLGQYGLARAAYAAVPVAHPAFPLAELGRAEALRREGDIGAAIEVLSALTRDRPEMAAAHGRLGDYLRAESRLDEALAAYDTALSLTPAADPGRWRLHYVRGVAHFRADDWPAAEADFVAALDLAPDQAAVLNFYGYCLVERGERLDAALDMIERAVRADPQNGAIVDSLGWAYFRLGRFDEAVAQLERAVSLEPGDPVVNDHLGDAFWAVGREREARFQWARALSYGPEEAEAPRIRRKLEIGLDAVLAEDGAPPLEVAGSGG